MTPAYGSTVLPVRPRALVVDDESAIRSVLQRYLARRGWDVDLAEDGAQARDLLQPGPASRLRVYDLIIADVHMGQFGGAQLYAWIAEHRAELLGRFVVSTGDISADGATDILRSAPCRVLQKPFELPALGRILAEVVGEQGRQKSA